MGEEMHKNECDWSGGHEVLRGKRGRSCVKRDMKAMGIKEEMAQDRCAWSNILLGVRPVLARMPEIPCVFWGHGRINEYDDMI